MIGSLRLNGSTACMTIDGATDTDVFQEYVRVVLPTPEARRHRGPGKSVPHKNAQTIAPITAAGATVRFLPPYSPDLNLIEMMWSKVKNSLRAAEARTHPDLLCAIGQALQKVSPEDARNWFAHAGYSFIKVL